MSPREKKNTMRVNVFLSDDDYNEIKAIANVEGSNSSLVIRRAVKEYLKRKKEERT